MKLYCIIDNESTPSTKIKQFLGTKDWFMLLFQHSYYYTTVMFLYTSFPYLKMQQLDF